MKNQLMNQNPLVEEDPMDTLQNVKTIQHFIHDVLHERQFTKSLQTDNTLVALTFVTQSSMLALGHGLEQLEQALIENNAPSNG